MKYGWVENQAIFLAYRKEDAPAHAIEFPDNVELQHLKIVDGQLTLKSEEEIKTELLQTFQHDGFLYVKQLLNRVLTQYGFYDLTEVNNYLKEGDEEALKINEFYLTLENVFWSLLDELKTKSLTELQGFNIIEAIQSRLKEVGYNEVLVSI